MLAMHQGSPVTILSKHDYYLVPRWLIPVDKNSMLMRHYCGRMYNTFLECVQDVRPRRIAFVRTHALGDILMLIPIIRAVRRALELPERIVVLTEDRFVDLAPSLLPNPDVEFRLWNGVKDYGADIHYNLNHCLEQDHWGGEASNHHRVALYAQALGMEVEAV